jgi:hypothetical protein
MFANLLRCVTPIVLIGSALAPVAVQALTIDNFGTDDGTPINISSTGNYQSSFDTGLPSGDTIGSDRVGVVRAFLTTDRMHLSVNDLADGSAGVARIEGSATTTGTPDDPDAGFIWNGSTNDVLNNDLGLAPLDLSKYNAFIVRIASGVGDLRFNVNLASGLDRAVGAYNPFSDVPGSGVVIVPFSELVSYNANDPFSELPNATVLSNVGAIGLNFFAKHAGSFDYYVDSFEAGSLPEPSSLSLLAIVSIAFLVVARRKSASQDRA